MARRERQLAYSDLQPKMHDEAGRRRKAQKILAVLRHFLGVPDLQGRTVLDVGSSTGFIADELRGAGGRVVGIDIDAPGLAAARRTFGASIGWVTADGEALPLRDASVDVVVFNHIYEHVIDPDAVMRELRRVLRPDGVAYLGFGNRLGVIEPHVRLPFASWLPPRAADTYVRLARRGDRYHERFRTKPGLRTLARGLHVWDYTWTVIAEPERFAAHGDLPGPLSRVPSPLLKPLAPVIPTYIWVGTMSGAHPAGPTVAAPPRRVQTPPAG
jgi:SAM-dependent methyltransferase